jgi:hypothetical protein
MIIIPYFIIVVQFGVIIYMAYKLRGNSKDKF